MSNAKERLIAQIEESFAEGAKVIDEALHLTNQTMSLRPLFGVLNTVTHSVSYTHLPKTLGSEHRLPIASMYVELSVSNYGVHAKPNMIARSFTLASEVEEKREALNARRVPLKEVIEDVRHNNIVILGDPGSGKTSLMKYLCREIALGNSSRWVLPVFVSVREYWHHVKSRKKWDESLLTYACQKLLEEQNLSEQTVSDLTDPALQKNKDIDELNELLVRLSGKQRKNVLFVIDGFDEIASSTHAVEFVTHSINTLSASFSWVLTTRYTGFFGGIDEDQKYEMVSLNLQSIQELSENWFGHVCSDQAVEHTSSLLRQLKKNQRSLMMARNPFLLTLLCLLQYRSGKALPMSRAGVYKSVIGLVRQQARDDTGKQTVLSLADIKYLSKFCLFLYQDVADETLQLFDRDLWDKFSYPKKSRSLDKYYLPSRLLTSIDIEQNNFYFVHLTFQEYFVALALSEKPFEHIKQYIYNPSWRMVIRFVGSILWNDDRAKFNELIHHMSASIDWNGFVYIEIAWILADVAIEDCSSMLDFDLCEELMDRVIEGAEYVAEEAAEALAVLNPEYAISRLKKLLDHEPTSLLNVVDGDEIEGLEATREEVFMLVHIFNKEADDLLVSLLNHDDFTVARTAAIAISRKNTPELRKKLLVETREAGNRLTNLIARIALQTAHIDFLPWVFTCLDQIEIYDSETKPLIYQALETLAQPGMDIELLQRLGQYSDQEPPKELIRSFIALKTDVSQEWLSNFLKIHKKHPIVFDAIELGLLGDEKIEEALQISPEYLSKALGSVKNMIRVGYQVSEKSSNIIQNIAFGKSTLAPKALSVLSAMELHYGIYERETGINPEHYRKILACDDAEKLQEVILLLAQLNDIESIDRIRGLALSYESECEGESEYVRILAVNAFIYYSSIIERQQIFDLYSEILAGVPEDADLQSSALAVCIYDAIGEIDFRQLIVMGDTQVVFSSLARACAMEGVLVFDEGYVDFDGSLRAWDYPRISELPKLTLELDAEGVKQNLAYLLNHYLNVEKSVSKSGKYTRGSKKPPLFKGNYGSAAINSVDKATGKKILAADAKVSEASINKMIDWLLHIRPKLIEEAKAVYGIEELDLEKHRYHIIIAVAYHAEDELRMFSR